MGWDGPASESMGYGEGEMTERMRVTEGLVSAMLSIWLRDVLCSCTVPQCMDIRITRDTYEAMVSLTVGANSTESSNDKPTQSESPVLTADMRLGSAGVRARRAAEPSEPEPEEATESVHHEHSHSEHHEHSHTEHHPGHDYDHMKNKFMNELSHLPSKKLL